MLRRFLALSVLAAACTGGTGATSAPSPALTAAPPVASASITPTAVPATAPPTSAEPTLAEPTTAATETVALSDEGYFVGPDGMSLYTFDNDEQGVSNCEGDCLVNWPPLLIESGFDIVVGDGLDQTQFGTVARSDGTLQVAYNDMPLYYFIGDSEPGDVNGDGVGDVWHLATLEDGAELTPNPDDYY